MKNIANSSIKFVLIMLLTAAFAPSSSSPGYHIAKTHKLGGEGGWDYVTLDNSAHRLYISRATRVMVMDTESGKTVGEISDTPGVHGIALVPAGARARSASSI